MPKKVASESVAETNSTVLGNAASFYQNMQMSNAVSHQQALQQLELALTAKAASLILSSGLEGPGGENLAAMLEMLKELKKPGPIEPNVKPQE